MSQLAPSAGPSPRDRWMGLLAAFLGWMFDGLEMGIFPIISRPALTSMFKAQGIVDDKIIEGMVGQWNGNIGACFLIGAALGGFTFGWLGDKIGRVKAMSFSILTYSVFSGLCYFAQDQWQLGGLRCVAALGMGGEWSLGVALVMELWDGKHRWLLAAAIGAAVNLGFALIAAITAFGWKVDESSWRWVMLIGALPALLTFFIRLFVPESHHWQAAQDKAAEKGEKINPLREIFQPNLIRMTFTAIVLASIPQIGTWGSISNIVPWVDKLSGGTHPEYKSYSQLCSSIGSAFGCFFGTWLAHVSGRRIAFFGLCFCSLVLSQILFRTFTEFNTAFMVMVFFIGFFASSFYGWLPLYLPELFPTRVRATGQGLGYNTARIFSAIGSVYMGGFVKDWGWAKTCGTVAFIYGLGMIVIWFAPETKGKELPE